MMRKTYTNWIEWVLRFYLMYHFEQTLEAHCAQIDYMSEYSCICTRLTVWMLLFPFPHNKNSDINMRDDISTYYRMQKLRYVNTIHVYIHIICLVIEYRTYCMPASDNDPLNHLI